MTNVFEQPWLLLIVAGVVFLAVVVFRGLLPKRGKWLFWLLPVVIAGLAFAIDFFVVTDAEKVEGVIAGAVKAVEKEDVKALATFISDDYRDSFNQSKRHLLRNCASRLSEPIIEKNVLRIVSLKVEGDKATVVFTVRVVFDPQGLVYGYVKMMPFKLQADLRKQSDNWLLTRVEVLEINLQPADWKNLQGAGEAF